MRKANTRKTRRRMLSVCMALAMVFTLFTGMAGTVSGAEQETVLQIAYGNETIPVTKATWDQLTSEQSETVSYSVLSKKGVVSTSQVKGIPLAGILEAVGINVDSGKITNLKFTSISDGASRELSVQELLKTARYAYSYDSEGNLIEAETKEVPTVITENGGLMMGQTSTEDTNGYYCLTGLFSSQGSGVFTAEDYAANGTHLAISIDGSTGAPTSGGSESGGGSGGESGGESGNTEPVEEADTVLQISYEGTTVAISQEQWNTLKEDLITESYSALGRGAVSSAASYGEETGVSLKAILQTAGIDADLLSDQQELTFNTVDGAAKSLTVKYLFNTERFAYPTIGEGDDLQFDATAGKQVEPIITTTGRLIIGQSDPDDRNKQYWMKGMFAVQDDGTFTQEDLTTNAATTAIVISDGITDVDKDGTIAEGYASGSGTAEDPYIIKTAGQLRYFAQQINDGKDNDKCFKLANHIDLNDLEWTAAGSVEKPFSGTFDGNGRTISGLNVTSAASYEGFFGYSIGTIQNMTLKGTVTNSSTSGSQDFVGGLVGFNAGSITGVISHVTVNAGGANNVGGIAGFNTSGKWVDEANGKAQSTVLGASGNISSCGNEGAVTGYKKTGGIVGENAGTIDRCYNKATITNILNGSGGGVGGIAGRNGNNGTAYETGIITNCYNAGVIDLNGGRWAGGLCGWANNNSIITNCYVYGEILKGYKDWAPLFPRSDGQETVTNCYSLEGLINDQSVGNEKRTGTILTEAEMKADSFVTSLGAAYAKDTTGINNGYPVLKWQGGSGVSEETATLDTFEITGAKTDYVEGQEFTLDGANILAVYSDGSKEQVVLTESQYQVYRGDAENREEAGSLKVSDNDTELTVSFTLYGKTVEVKYKVMVEAKKVESIKVSTAPTKKTYASGETFDPAGMKVTVTYGNEGLSGSEKTVQITEGFTCTPTTALSDENKTITVSYTEGDTTKTDSFNVIVVNLTQPPATDLDGYYLLEDADDLIWFANSVSLLGRTELNARLVNNIDVSTAETADRFIPIGVYSMTGNEKIVTQVAGTSISCSYSNGYSGSFDGNGKTVTVALTAENNKTFTESTWSNIGLFGYVDGGAIKDVTVAGSVNGSSYVGGLVGRATSLNVSGCTNQSVVASANTTGQKYIGGLVGYITGADSKIQNCTNLGDITSYGFRTGGILGSGGSSDNTTIINCINKGTITGTGYAGGIAGGYVKNISQCGNQGNLVCSTYNVGGIIGYATTAGTEISDCYNTGAITGSKSVGGIIGCASIQASIGSCYNKGSVQATAATATEGAGGLLGTKSSTSKIVTLSNSYNIGNVSITGGTTTNQGMLVGYTKGTTATSKTSLLNCYYLNGDEAKSVGGTIANGQVEDESAAKIAAQLSDPATFGLMSANYKTSCGGAILSWQADSEATAHQYQWTVEQEATFTEAGSEKQICSVCGHEGETRAITPAGIQTTIDAIDEIGTVTFTAESKGKIDEARSYYDRLAAYDQEQNTQLAAAVTNYNKLTAAEARYQQLMDEATQAQIDENAAAAVDSLIGEIDDTITMESESGITAARTGYNNLSDAQKLLVKDYDRLQKAEADFAAVKKADDQSKANQVLGLINIISDPVSLNDTTIVKQAKAAFDKLTEDQKALISQSAQSKLTGAVATIAKLSLQNGSGSDSNTDPTDSQKNGTTNKLSYNSGSYSTSAGTKSGSGTDSSDKNSTAGTKTIKDEATPASLSITDEGKSGTTSESETWSIINLLLTLATLALCIVMIANHVRRRPEGMSKYITVCSLIPSILAIAGFAVTQSFSGGMGIVDRYTLLMAGIFVIQGVLALLSGGAKAKQNDLNI